MQYLAGAREVKRLEVRFTARSKICRLVTDYFLLRSPIPSHLYLNNLVQH